MIKKPTTLRCPTCNCLRKVPDYWGRTADKMRLKIMNRQCKKCGTGRKKSHGLGQHPIYMVWYNMMVRCGHKDAYVRETVIKNYRDKGIIVCKQWRRLETFSQWAFENGYREGLYLDRKSNSKNYCPNNCRWVTSTISGQHRAKVKLSLSKARKIRTLHNKGIGFGELAKQFMVHQTTIKRICQNETWKNC
jgi:hypothetical protein